MPPSDLTADHQPPITRCDWCDEPLTEEEEAFPQFRNGDLVCQQCLCDDEHFTCCWCENCGEEEDQHRYVMVFDHHIAGTSLPGLYRVERPTYYAAGIIGSGWLDPSALTWLGFLATLKADPQDYPCGHLCSTCQERALAEIAYETRCMAYMLEPL